MKLRLTTDDAGALMAVLRRERKLRGMTVLEMADRFDREADVIDVGFLRDYAQALGGRLTITVELP